MTGSAPTTLLLASLVPGSSSCLGNARVSPGAVPSLRSIPRVSRLFHSVLSHHCVPSTMCLCPHLRVPGWFSSLPGVRRHLIVPGWTQQCVLLLLSFFSFLVHDLFPDSQTRLVLSPEKTQFCACAFCCEFMYLGTLRMRVRKLPSSDRTECPWAPHHPAAKG